MALENNTNKQTLEQQKIALENLEQNKENQSPESRAELLKDIQSKMEQATPKVEVAAHETKQVEELGGSTEELNNIVSQDDKGIADIDAQIKQLKEQVTAQLNNEGGSEATVETRELPPGHILNKDTLDKIAQLEAIDPNTGIFSQQRYDDYIDSQSKLGAYSVGENQKKIKEAIDMGDTISDVHQDLELIHGTAGWNKYAIDLDGKIGIVRGANDKTSTNPAYEAIRKKAAELGIEVR